jgi:hypothetical protein
MVTFLASHDRIFYLLAPLLYWLLSSREVIFTVQGSRTACITQSLTHTSGCPVRRVLHRMYVSPWVATPLMLPSRPSLPKAWPTIPLHFVPASILQDIKISTYRLVLLLFGHVVGHWQGVCFMSAVGLDFIVMHHPPLPFIRRMACAPSVGDFRMMSGQISTAQWKSVMFSGYLTTRPNLHVN